MAAFVPMDPNGYYTPLENFISNPFYDIAPNAYYQPIQQSHTIGQGSRIWETIFDGLDMVVNPNSSLNSGVRNYALDIFKDWGGAAGQIMGGAAGAIGSGIGGAVGGAASGILGGIVGGGGLGGMLMLGLVAFLAYLVLK